MDVLGLHDSGVSQVNAQERGVNLGQPASHRYPFGAGGPDKLFDDDRGATQEFATSLRTQGTSCAPFDTKVPDG